MNKRSVAAAILAAALSAAAAAAVDSERGKDLHDANCIACHASLMNGEPTRIYTRPGRRVTTLEGLRKQVRRCELSLQLRWFDDQVEDVVHYLNTTFYKFQ